MSDLKTTKYIDRLKDERQWVDLVGLVYYMAGQHDAKIPVEWGRTRIIKFLKKKQGADVPRVVGCNRYSKWLSKA